MQNHPKYWAYNFVILLVINRPSCMSIAWHAISLITQCNIWPQHLKLSQRQTLERWSAFCESPRNVVPTAAYLIVSLRCSTGNGLGFSSIFKGYDIITCMVVANLAFSGLLVSWVMKFADSIMKVRSLRLWDGCHAMQLNPESLSPSEAVAPLLWLECKNPLREIA